MWKFRPTLKLLTDSVLVAISGGFKLYVAYLFLGVKPDISICLSFSLIVYAVYTLDRALECSEDSINREDLNTSRRGYALVAVPFSLISSFLISIHKVSTITLFIPFLIGFMYTQGVSIGDSQLRLKKGIGIKNFVTAFTWATTIIAFLNRRINNPVLRISIWLFFFFKSFINTVIYDFKDVKGDAAAGLITLPIWFGDKTTRRILLSLNFLLHIEILLATIRGFVHFEPVILLYSAAVSFFYTSFYCNTVIKRGLFRDILIDGEWINAVMLRFIINHV